MKRPELWGPLKARYQTPAPRKMLALDGGGIRGVLTLSILKSIETQLGTKLCDYFDYIAGTSTGAIIAAGLSIGKSVDELIDFYRADRHGDVPAHAVPRASEQPLQERAAAAEAPGGVRRSGTSSPSNLKTLLLAVTHNVTTDSPWPISSNPEARYNLPERDGLQPLHSLVAARSREHRGADLLSAGSHSRPSHRRTADRSCSSTAASRPTTTPRWCSSVSRPIPAYRLEWPTGERNMLLVSVGTGAAATEGASAEDPTSNMLSTGLAVPGALMYGALVDQDMNCRAIGRCTYGDVIDREVLDMVPREGPDEGNLAQRLARPRVPLDTDLGRAFLYARYNVDLSREGLDALGFPNVSLGDRPKDGQSRPRAHRAAAEDRRRGGEAGRRQAALRVVRAVVRPLTGRARLAREGNVMQAHVFVAMPFGTKEAKAAVAATATTPATPAVLVDFDEVYRA